MALLWLVLVGASKIKGFDIDWVIYGLISTVGYGTCSGTFYLAAPKNGSSICFSFFGDDFSFKGRDYLYLSCYVLETKEGCTRKN